MASWARQCSARCGRCELCAVEESYSSLRLPSILLNLALEMQLENECKTPGVIKETIPLAGLNINLFKTADEDLSKDVVVLFFLHGRFGSADKVQWVPERLVKETAGKGNRELFVITLVSGWHIVASEMGTRWAGSAEECI